MMTKNHARGAGMMAVLALLALAPASTFADRGRNEGKRDGKEIGKKSPFTAIPVSGTSADGNVFKGTMDVGGFVNDEFGKTKAIGVLNGTITDRFGNSVQVANQVVSLPVLGGPGAVGAQAIGAQAVCNVLNLVLGPLDLNLLGLTVHLDTVRLVIDAVPGAGNLLGNLLCAVASLLDGLAIGPILTQLLNQLVALLAGI